MTIIINDQEVDFTLEGGETAIEIYSSIKAFLKETDYLIYSFAIDGENTDPEESDSWGSAKADEIERIEVVALTEDEYRLTGLLTIAEYVNFLMNAVHNKEFDELKGMTTEYPSILQNIPYFVKGDLGNLIQTQLEKTMRNSGLLEGSFKDDYTTDFLKEIAGISELISMAAREIQDPLEELKSSFKALDLLKPRLSDVSVLLQTGKDHEAMEIVISLTEILNKIFRLISMFNTDNIDTDQLNSILSELAEAFDAGDSVLIGDLLEYEITPMLDSLSDVLNQLEEKEE